MGRERTHAPSWIAEESCPCPARRACRVARRRRRREAVAGGGGGSRVWPGPPPGLTAGSPTPPDVPGPAARGLRRSPTCAGSVGSSRPRNFHSGERAGGERPAPQAPPARPHSPAPRSPGAGSPPPARVRGALSRPGAGDTGPASLPRLNPKGSQTINKSKSFGAAAAARGCRSGAAGARGSRSSRAGGSGCPQRAGRRGARWAPSAAPSPGAAEPRAPAPRLQKR